MHPCRSRWRRMKGLCACRGHESKAIVKLGTGRPLAVLGLPPEQVKALAAEKRIAVIRLAVILFNVATYYAFLARQQGIPWLAAAVSVVAVPYGFYVVLAQPYRVWPVMRAAMFTALTDGVLI